MSYRCRGAGLQVLDAADIGRNYTLRRQRGELGELAVAQLVCQFRLQHRVGTRRAAAQVALSGKLDIEAQRLQVRFHVAAQLLTVLQRARRMERELARIT